MVPGMDRSPSRTAPAIICLPNLMHGNQVVTTFPQASPFSHVLPNTRVVVRAGDLRRMRVTLASHKTLH